MLAMVQDNIHLKATRLLFTLFALTTRKIFRFALNVQPEFLRGCLDILPNLLHTCFCLS